MALDILLFAVGLILAAFTLSDVFETVVVPGGSRASLKVAKRLLFILLPLWKAARGRRHGLSGAFAPLEQLPKAIQYLSEIFPLTHFCRAFRLVNMYQASTPFYLKDLIVLFAGAIITFIGAALLLRRIEE